MYGKGFDTIKNTDIPKKQKFLHHTPRRARPGVYYVYLTLEDLNLNPHHFNTRENYDNYSFHGCAHFVHRSVFLDLRRNKGDKSLRFGIRALAGLGSSALLLAGMLVSRHWDIASLVVCLIFSDEILMMFPCSYEKPKPAFDAALTVLIVNFAILIYFGWKERGIYDFQRLKNLITVLVLITSFLAFFITVSVRKFSGIRQLFRNNAVWYNVEEHARFIYSLIFLGLCIIVTCSSWLKEWLGTGFALPAVIFLLGLYTLLFFRALTGRTYLIRRETEDRIKEMVKGNLRTSYVDKAEEDRKMSMLYKRIMNHMTDKKPYLTAPSACPIWPTPFFRTNYISPRRSTSFRAEISGSSSTITGSSTL